MKHKRSTASNIYNRFQQNFKTVCLKEIKVKPMLELNGTIIKTEEITKKKLL